MTCGVGTQSRSRNCLSASQANCPGERVITGQCVAALPCYGELYTTN